MDPRHLKDRDIETILGGFLFRGISEDKLRRICSADGCTLLKFEKGDVIYSPEAFLKSCGLILSGSVKVTKASPGGQELFMNALKRGALFGAAALWDGHDGYVASLTALEKCRILFFSQELMESAMKAEPELALNYIRFLTGRVCFLNDKIQSLIAGRSSDTLAHYLEMKLEHSGESFELDMGMTELAAALNISRASLYRAFEALENKKALVRNGRKITILDKERLRGF